MLKTNTKKARQNVREYIVNHFDPSDYDGGDTVNCDDFGEVARFILDTFESEKFYDRGNRQELFEDWAQGLPSVLDTCYYYNRSAVDDLGAILEETDAEKSKYSEQQAEHVLTYLIYSELVKGATSAANTTSTAGAAAL